jgi:acyl-coenzyme A synthetase/AMP-(fatty) acid ligase
VVDELPVNATGKVVKDELRARVVAGNADGEEART